MGARDSSYLRGKLEQEEEDVWMVTSRVGRFESGTDDGAAERTAKDNIYSADFLIE